MVSPLSEASRHSSLAIAGSDSSECSMLFRTSSVCSAGSTASSAGSAPSALPRRMSRSSRSSRRMLAGSASIALNERSTSTSVGTSQSASGNASSRLFDRLMNWSDCSEGVYAGSAKIRLFTTLSDLSCGSASSAMWSSSQIRFDDTSRCVRDLISRTLCGTRLSASDESRSMRRLTHRCTRSSGRSDIGFIDRSRLTIQSACLYTNTGTISRRIPCRLRCW